MFELREALMNLSRSNEQNEISNNQRTIRKEKLGHIFQEVVEEQQKAVQEQNDLFIHQEETTGKQKALRIEQHDVQQEILKQQCEKKMPCSPEMSRNTAIIQEQMDLGDYQQTVITKSRQILYEIQDMQKKLDFIKNEMQQLSILSSMAKNSNNESK
jgi:hypothetical protein